MERDKRLDKVLSKLRRYCAFRERCTSEVFEKMRSFDLQDTEKEDLLATLYSDGFLDDNRYASAFVSGKFRQNKWGRRKIRSKLIAKRLPSKLIDEALGQIGDEAYEQTLIHILRKKIQTLRDPDPAQKREKLIRFALSRGYEHALVFRLVDRVL